jgi:hypothetical protein
MMQKTAPLRAPFCILKIPVKRKNRRPDPATPATRKKEKRKEEVMKKIYLSISYRPIVKKKSVNLLSFC